MNDIELRHLLDYMNERNYTPHHIEYADGEITLKDENDNSLIEQAVRIIKKHQIVILDFIDREDRIYGIDIILSNDRGSIVHDCYWKDDYKYEWGCFYKILCQATEEFLISTDFVGRYFSNAGWNEYVKSTMEEA